MIAALLGAIGKGAAAAGRGAVRFGKNFAGIGEDGGGVAGGAGDQMQAPIQAGGGMVKKAAGEPGFGRRLMESTIDAGLNSQANVPGGEAGGFNYSPAATPAYAPVDQMQDPLAPEPPPMPGGGGMRRMRGMRRY
jgi:hypothetical protein